jgi:hypothetical protein
LLQEPSGGKKVAYGENSVREARTGCCYTLHAEMDAIRRLPPCIKKGHRKEIDLVVIRIDRHGCLKNSRPCSMCIKHMWQLNRTSSYRLQSICYSNEHGNIVCCKLIDLINAKEKHTSQRFKK